MEATTVRLSRAEIDRIFEAFENKCILVLGDAMLDAYWWGKVDRISPEAPVPIVNVERKEYRLGGAANVALNLKELHAKPILCSVVGQDAEGERLSQLAGEQGIDVSGLIIVASRPTTVKTRVIGNKNQLIRVDAENDEPLNDKDSAAILGRIEQLLPQADILLIEDYDKGVLTPDVIEKVITMAASNGIPVAVDPKKRNFLHYKNVTLFKPNLRELAEGLKLDLDGRSSMKEIGSAVHQLKEKLSALNALITLSDRGVFISGADNDYLIPAHIRNIYDVSGAGDTVISVAALALLAEVEAPVIAALANLAGGLVCEKLGVVPVTYDELYDHAVQEFAQES
jgi:D-glycero-beta-D-manno-heptose-7-phosphate kinase